LFNIHVLNFKNNNTLFKSKKIKQKKYMLNKKNIVILNLLTKHDEAADATKTGLGIKHNATDNVQIIELHEAALEFVRRRDLELFKTRADVVAATEVLKNADKVFILAHGDDKEENANNCFYIGKRGVLCPLFSSNELANFIGILLNEKDLNGTELKSKLVMCYGALLTPRNEDPIPCYLDPTRNKQVIKSSFAYKFFHHLTQKHPQLALTMTASTMSTKTNRTTGKFTVDTFEFNSKIRTVEAELIALSQKINKKNKSNEEKSQLIQQKAGLNNYVVCLLDGDIPEGKTGQKEKYGMVFFKKTPSNTISIELKHPENHHPQQKQKRCCSECWSIM
jgi:hypothetical protein